jgi:nitrite reductase/ring-hydroxylating ferredoxin subunit
MPEINLGSISELKKQPLQCVTEDEHQYVLIHLNGEFYLLDNLCPHKAAALCDGDVKGNEIHCPWHKAKFDIHSGRALTPLGGHGVQSYSLIVQQGQLIAQIP